jgi:excisionase family DNA binding protein
VLRAGQLRRVHAPRGRGGGEVFPKGKIMSEKLLSPKEVAAILGVSAGWVRDHATRKKPRLQCVRLGKLMRFRREDVEAFVSQMIQGSAA